jgi:hypothetical protein
MGSSVSETANIQTDKRETKSTTVVQNRSDPTGKKRYGKKPQGRTRESDTCNKCGELGHWYADCPKLSAEEKAT